MATHVIGGPAQTPGGPGYGHGSRLDCIPQAPSAVSDEQNWRETRDQPEMSSVSGEPDPGEGEKEDRRGGSGRETESGLGFSSASRRSHLIRCRPTPARPTVCLETFNSCSVYLHTRVYITSNFESEVWGEQNKRKVRDEERRGTKRRETRPARSRDQYYYYDLVDLQ